tara:strand:- start:41 stop:298 length:258 start_codon:yes stop_codon:yes gene_type:complete
LFVFLCGTLAGNLAFQLLSKGGIYIGVRIALNIAPLLKQEAFVEVFLSKGRFETYLSEIPLIVVMDETAPLMGAAQYDLAHCFVN